MLVFCLVVSVFHNSFIRCLDLFLCGQQIIPTSWKGRKFQMSTPIWLTLLIVGRYEIILSMWGKFSDKKTWIGIEENSVVQKVLCVVFKIRCILWGWCTVRQVMPKKMPKADGIDHLLILLLVPHQWPEDLDNYLTLSTKSSLGYLKPAFWAIWDPWGHVRHLHEAGGYEGPNEWWL